MAETTSADLERRLRLVEDRLAIEDLGARYCQGFDDHRWDEIVTELFTEDAVFDILAKVESRAAIARFFADVTAEGLGATWHYEINRRIEIDGDTASVESMFFCPCVRNGEAWLAAGRYTDTVRRDGGTWRFAVKRGRFDYFLPLADGWEPGRYGFPEASAAARRPG